jgi:hypothetical protein
MLDSYQKYLGFNRKKWIRKGENLENCFTSTCKLLGRKVFFPLFPVLWQAVKDAVSVKQEASGLT